MYRIAITAVLLTGEALAHSGHGAPDAHHHGWEYALLAAAIAAAAASWIKLRK